MNKPTQHSEYFGGSIEHSSVLRKFTILFMVMSLMPMMVLFYLYYQLKYQGGIRLTESDLNLTLLFIVFGVITGYVAMRNVLQKLIHVTRENTKMLSGVLSPANLEELDKEKNEIDVLSQAFKVMTSHLEENIKALETTKKTLSTVMTKVGQGISSSNNIDSFLELILETIIDALQGDVGVLFIYDRDDAALLVKVVHGTKYNVAKDIRLRTVAGSAMHPVIKSKKPMAITDFSDDMKEAVNAGLLKVPLVCAPLISNDTVHGVITISHGKVSENLEDDDLAMLLNLASQTAVAIENSYLSKNIEATYFETISALALAVDAKDKYSRGHLDRVAQYCVQIAEELELDEDDIKVLRDAARLHDLGKIGIPDGLLKKEGKLNEEEWEMMRKHPEMGESIIKPIKSLNHLCDIIRHHHEKLDGSGYPDGLKGDEISKLVRITTVADIYDALTTDRSYRDKMTREKAIEILTDMKNELDQDIVQAFIRSLPKEN